MVSDLDGESWSLQIIMNNFKKDQTVTAADTFSSLKRTIKSKFITEEAIPEAERALELEEQVKVEEEEHRRPLYFQLKENRQKNEEEFEEMFKLSSRFVLALKCAENRVHEATVA